MCIRDRSEGYDDRGRYQIMQKVGMSKKEVRRSIKTQVLMVFFLPLIAAIIHAVSYTHLDVYKRQIMGNVLALPIICILG